MNRLTGLVLTALLCWLTGCVSSYVVPAGGVHPATLDVDSPAAADARHFARPEAAFPAHIAVARVQASGYQSRDAVCYGTGRFTLVTSSETNLLDSANALAALPNVAGVAAISSILLPENLNSDADLRRAAARLNADMLLLYTLNDSVRVDDHEIGPLGVLSLGTLPNHEARVVANCQAVLMDTRSGYIYATSEASGDESQYSGIWTTDSAVDRARVTAEKKAIARLIPQFTAAWGGVVAQYAADARPANLPTGREYPTPGRGRPNGVNVEESR